MSRPDLSRVPEWYHRYIDQVTENELMPAFRNQSASFAQFLEQLPDSKRDFRYAPGKWSIKELLQHIIDAERIFSYRALCFARKDATPLPSFEENDYADNAKTDNRNWDDMVEEFKTVRKASEIMFGSFDDEQLESAGIASGKSVYVRAIGYIMVGHVNHHVNVIRERYLVV
jgi:hypothetical protein